MCPDNTFIEYWKEQSMDWKINEIIEICKDRVRKDRYMNIYTVLGYGILTHRMQNEIRKKI